MTAKLQSRRLRLMDFPLMHHQLRHHSTNPKQPNQATPWSELVATSRRDHKLLAEKTPETRHYGFCFHQRPSLCKGVVKHTPQTNKQDANLFFFPTNPLMESMHFLCKKTYKNIVCIDLSCKLFIVDRYIGYCNHWSY